MQVSSLSSAVLQVSKWEGSNDLQLESAVSLVSVLAHRSRDGHVVSSLELVQVSSELSSFGELVTRSVELDQDVDVALLVHSSDGSVRTLNFVSFAVLSTGNQNKRVRETYMILIW